MAQADIDDGRRDRVTSDERKQLVELRRQNRLLAMVVEIFEAGQRTAGISPLDLLVLVAGLAMLFTGRYPPSLFDLIMGINRWVYRVTAYVARMRDEYPPFRLDQGAAEPGATRDRTENVATGADGPSAVEGPPAPDRQRHDWVTKGPTLRDFAEARSRSVPCWLIGNSG